MSKSQETYLQLKDNVVIKVKFTYYPAEKGIRDYLGFQEEPDVDEYYTIEDIQQVQGTLLEFFDWLNNKAELENCKLNLYEILENQIKRCAENQ